MEKQLIPQLRFSEFQGDWKKFRIQKLIDDNIILGHLDGNHGSLYPRSSEFVEEGVPYISANNFINGEVELDNVKYLRYSRAKKFRKGIAKDGDVLFAHNATVGPSAILETSLEFVILSTTATYYRCDNHNIFNLYLNYYFKTSSFVKQYSKVMAQSTRNQVPITMQRKFFVTKPSLPEQQKIASFLTDVDTKITQLTKKKELLEQYKKGIMQQLFNQELRFKDDDGNEFPEWEEKKLGEIATKQSSNISANTIEENFGEYKIYGASGLLKKIDFYREEEPYISIVKDGAGVGRTLLCDAFSSVLGTLDIIKPKNGVNLYFIYCLLNNINFLKFITGSTIPHIYFKDYSAVKIAIPCLEEQTKIANFLSDIDAKIESVHSQIERSKTFKKGLLQQMFV